MKLIKNKKSQGGVGAWVMAHIIELIIGFTLLAFFWLWYSGIGNDILDIIKSI